MPRKTSVILNKIHLLFSIPLWDFCRKPPVAVAGERLSTGRFSERIVLRSAVIRTILLLCSIPAVVERVQDAVQHITPAAAAVGAGGQR